MLKLKLIEDDDGKDASKPMRDVDVLRHKMQWMLEQLKVLNATHARLRKIRDAERNGGQIMSVCLNNRKWILC